MGAGLKRRAFGAWHGLVLQATVLCTRQCGLDKFVTQIKHGVPIDVTTNLESHFGP